MEAFARRDIPPCVTVLRNNLLPQGMTVVAEFQEKSKQCAVEPSCKTTGKSVGKLLQAMMREKSGTVGNATFLEGCFCEAKA